MSAALHLFEAMGIEIELMIVDAETLAVRPVADRLLRSKVGRDTTDAEDGPVHWSNELTRHVIELKVDRPTPSLAGWTERFGAAIREINDLLRPMGARLLPGSMHPTMDPRVETELWPLEGNEIYSLYDRIFDCRRHGWANLQSTHINLPFHGDDEFARLHAACRAVLPLLPALAASSPVMEGRSTGYLDSRLHVYLTHQARISAAMGEVVPEPVYSRREYQREILEPMYREIRPHDPEGLLQHEFLNARGAIARFDRGAIEIRVLDTQECAAADLAVALFVVSLVRALAEERWIGLDELSVLESPALLEVLRTALRDGERARIEHAPLLRAFGATESTDAGDLLERLAAEVCDENDPAWRELGPTLERMLEAGPLARRLLRALGSEDPGPGNRDDGRLLEIWRRLADCLAAGELFEA